MSWEGGTQPFVSMRELCVRLKMKLKNFGPSVHFPLIFGTLTVCLHNKNCVPT